MIRLSVRLAFGGGREQWVRLVVTAVGVGLGAVLLLLAAVVFPAMRAHEARDAWIRTRAHNIRPAQDETRTDPMLWLVRFDGYAGQDIVVVDVAPLGPRAPLPPGLSRLPGPGELAVSPALARLMRELPRDQLADRYPGRITETVGEAALRYPGSLVVVVGYSPEQLRGRPFVEEVCSIESQGQSVALSRFGRVVLALGGAALLMPVLVLIGTATRLSAARREQRLAAMRLVGATPRQIRVVAVVETVIAAAAGTLIGFAGFAVARPYAARANIDGSPFFPPDLRLSWWAAVLIGVGAPVMAGVAALVSLRRVQVSPLGVTRQAAPGRPSWRRLLPLAGSAALFAASLPILVTAQGDGPLWMMAGALALLIAGIVIAGPWLTLAVGRLLTRASRGVPGLLAGHRLTDNPAVGFRAISGLVLAVFLVTMASVATSIAVTPQAGRDRELIPATAVGAQFLVRDSPLPSAEQANALDARIRAIPGVTGLLDVRWPTAAPPSGHEREATVVTRCAGLRATGLATCADPDVVVSLDARQLGNGVIRQASPAAADTTPERLPAFGVLVTTDGRRSTMETVRTAIEVGMPRSWMPWTGDELKADNHKQADQWIRISDAVLLAGLLMAGFSLAVSVAGGLVERKRPFALLRLAGMRPAALRRVLLAETAAPLVTVALASAALGLAVVSYIAWVTHAGWQPPETSYWWFLGGGLAASLGVAAAATIPLLGRLTSLETARFE
jgi:MFS family permease